MENELISQLWIAMKSHIPTADRSDAANDFISLLVDHDIVDDDLLDIASVDNMLKKAALAYIKEEPLDFEDDDDYNDIDDDDD
jgi:hypothetical protein